MGIHICDYMYVTFWFMHVKCVQCTFIWHIWELIRQTWENRFLPPRNDFINQNKNIDKVDADDNIDRGNQIYIIWSWATPLLCFVRPPPRKQCRSLVSDWNPLLRKRIRIQNFIDKQNSRQGCQPLLEKHDDDVFCPISTWCHHERQYKSWWPVI